MATMTDAALKADQLTEVLDRQKAAHARTVRGMGKCMVAIGHDLVQVEGRALHPDRGEDALLHRGEISIVECTPGCARCRGRDPAAGSDQLVGVLEGFPKTSEECESRERPNHCLGVER